MKRANHSFAFIPETILLRCSTTGGSFGAYRRSSSLQWMSHAPEHTREQRNFPSDVIPYGVVVGFPQIRQGFASTVFFTAFTSVLFMVFSFG